MQNSAKDRQDQTSMRPTLGAPTLSMLTAAYIILVANHSFWARAFNYFEGLLPLIVLAIGLTSLAAAIFVALSFRFVTKPVLIFMVLAAAAASWFMDSFGVIINRDMVRNAMQTTPAEAGHLITFGFLRHLLIFAVIPVGLLLWVKIEHRPFFSKLKRNLGLILLLLVVTAAAGLSQARTLSTTSRAHHDLVATLNPFAPIVSVTRYFIGTAKERNIVVQARGLDATVPPAPPGAKPRLLVVVAGETARAENFSLGGYQRDTNPELSKLDISYFTDTSSCGTATAVSIPCMFSFFGRGDYSHEKGLGTENVVDVVAHAGVRIEWWENNTGDKDVAKRITARSYSNENDPRFCKDHECLDEVMLANMDSWLDSVKSDAVLVVHQLGSHGPAYFQRYTDEQRRYTPDCRTAEIANCSREEITNAYDNTILATDHFLAAIINKLKAREGAIAGSMIYMSDHGESLGEKGIYLHGAPYFIAPSQQTHIPFVLWLGSETKIGIDSACLATRTQEPASHDNLSATVLGLMNITTKEYVRSLDVLASCRNDLKS